MSRFSIPLSRLAQGWLYLLLATALNAQIQRRMLLDFEDAGTWRLTTSSGLAHGAWFAAFVSFGSDREAARNGSYGGKINYVFDEQNAPWRVGFIRQKARILKGRIDSIEFHADALDSDGAVRFILLAADGKSFGVAPIPLQGKGWQAYKVAIDATTIKEFSKLRFPAAIKQIDFMSNRGGTGALYIDDVTLVGDFASQDQITIQPVYDSIFSPPDKEVHTRYLVRNSTGKLIQTKLNWAIRASGSDRGIFTLTQPLVIPPYGSTQANLNAGKLGPGAYEAKISISHDGVTFSYDDVLGVLEPNYRRINRAPMWFGVQDMTLWQIDDENRLHLDWMKVLGIDINRLVFTPSRFHLDAPLSKAGWDKIITPFETTGIDLVLSTSETPSALAKVQGDNRSAATDMQKLENYWSEAGRFFSGFKSIRYTEFWNEPDIGFFHGTLDEYKEMFAAFSRAMRKTAPHIKVGTGGVTVLHPREKKDFARRMYQETGELYDLVNFHAHGPLVNYTERLEMIEHWLKEASLDKPIANTESGERSGYTAKGRYQQAIELVKKMTYSKGVASSEFHLWFTLQDYWDFDPGADDSFGLVTSDNRAKPAFVAYNQLIRRLANTCPTKTRQVEGAVINGFKRDDGHYVYVLWPAAGKTTATVCARVAAPVKATSLFGRDLTPIPVSNAAIISLEREPVYLESEAPLAFLSPEENPLRAPSEIFIDTSVSTTFSVSLHNGPEAIMRGRISLNDQNQQEIWSHSVEISPNCVQEFTPTIPAWGEASPATTRHYLLIFEPVEPEGSPISLPISAQPVYPMVRLKRGDFRDRLAMLPAIELNQPLDVTELAFDPSIPAWQGVNDLSGRAWFAHDGENLLVHIDVKDDNHVQSEIYGSLWKGDSVQLAFFNPANAAHTLVDLGLSKAGPVVWLNKTADGSAAELWKVPVNFYRHDQVTTYETSLPLSKLGFDLPVRAAPIRFGLLVNENDGQGRVRWIQWFGGLGRNQNIDELGHGLLK